MTNGPPRRILEDGTRVYTGYHRYKPLPKDQRKYAVRKPEDPRAVRWGSQWLLPLELLDEALRSMPETRPDDEAYDHMAVTLICPCDVCARPTADKYQRRWLREQGIRPRIRK